MSDSVIWGSRKSPLTPKGMDLPSTADSKELKQWLAKSNCQQYYHKFIENGVTYDLLSELDSESLKELGVHKVGDRLKLEIAVSSLKSEKLKKVISIDELYNSLNLMNLSSPGTLNLSNYAIINGNESTLIPNSANDLTNNFHLSDPPLAGKNSLNNLGGNGGVGGNSSTGPAGVGNLNAGSNSNLTLNLNSVENIKNPNKTITFILADGSLKKVNVTGCFNAQSIKRKVLRKLGIKLQENSYDTYIQNFNASSTNNLNDSINLLFDVELVTICYSPDRLEKHRIMLCEKGQFPTEVAIEVSKKIFLKYERFNKSTKNLNQFRIQEKQALPTMRQFFGQRPPSELISSNLAEYFPDARQKELEQSVRNSVRYSVRLSKRFQLPQSGLGIGGSNLSINNSNYSNNYNKRFSIYSNSTMKNHSPSVSSGENNSSIQRRLTTGRTIGDLMMNNVNAIEEVVNPMADNQSVFSKPSIYSVHSDNSSTNRQFEPTSASSMSQPSQQSLQTQQQTPSSSSSLNPQPNHSPSPFNEMKSVHSNSSSNKPHNPRISIAASFVDQSKDNRFSRIELLNPESDEEDFEDDEADDLIGEYGDFDDENPFLDTVSEDGPKNWLKGARIGSGSFGTVYLGMSPLTGELMAVKQVSLTNNKNELHKAMVEALQHEMLLLKHLNHENIVRYLGSSTNDEFLNIFLEYVPGGSVQSMLNSYGPFEEPLIRNFIRQVLIGLSYLHGEDIIHRDIKGANILIDIKGTVKISDFGISKKITNDDSNNKAESNPEGNKKTMRRASLQGSVYWMAPEVVKQTAYTKKADIWSVGCLIVEMFTGKHPFPNFSQMQAIFKIGTHVSPAIPEWCTAEAKDFLIKTFELEYENRPDSVELLMEPFLNALIMSKQ